MEKGSNIVERYRQETEKTIWCYHETDRSQYIKSKFRQLRVQMDNIEDNVLCSK